MEIAADGVARSTRSDADLCNWLRCRGSERLRGLGPLAFRAMAY